MSLAIPGRTRPSLSIAPLPDLEPQEPLFPVEPQLVVADPPSLQDGLRAAALLWCTQSAWPTVRQLPAA